MNKQDLINNNIIKIELVFENCEGVIIPLECFEQLEYEINNKFISKFKCKIKLDSSIQCDLYDNATTPIERIYQYNDITHIVFIDTYDKHNSIPVEWYDVEDYNSNEYQTSELLSWDKLELNIDTMQEIYEEPSLNDIVELLKVIINKKAVDINTDNMSLGQLYAIAKEMYL